MTAIYTESETAILKQLNSSSWNLDRETVKNPREQMSERLVHVLGLQTILTQIIGKPFIGQKALLLQPIHYLLLYSICWILGILISSSCALDRLLYPLIPLGWILTVGATTGFQVGIVHAASHLNFSGKRKSDYWLGRICEVLIWMPEFDTYAVGHRIHHSIKGHQTPDDNTVRFYHSRLGLRPGMTVEQCWKQLMRSISSPFWHIQFLSDRLRACFWECSTRNKLLSWGFWGSILLCSIITRTLSLFIISYAVPMILYQACHALRLVVEHRFPSNHKLLEKRDKIYICESTQAILLATSLPKENLNGWKRWKAWSIFWIHFVLVHGLVRWLILPADSIVHDYHTRYPGTDDWCNAIWERQAEFETGSPKWPTNYTENWGYKAAINTVFYGISQLPNDSKFLAGINATNSEKHFL